MNKDQEFASFLPRIGVCFVVREHLRSKLEQSFPNLSLYDQDLIWEIAINSAQKMSIGSEQNLQKDIVRFYFDLNKIISSNNDGSELKERGEHS